jgi:hypothetical protein
MQPFSKVLLSEWGHEKARELFSQSVKECGVYGNIILYSGVEMNSEVKILTRSFLRYILHTHKLSYTKKNEDKQIPYIIKAYKMKNR